MTVKQYHDSLLGDQPSRHIIWQYWNGFMRLEEAGRYFMEGNEPVFTMEQTLEGFISDNEPEATGPDCLKKVKQAGHFPFLKACAKVFFTSQPHPKERLVWLHGPRNTGKSSFVELMEAIFSTQQFNFKQAYCTMDPP